MPMKPEALTKGTEVWMFQVERFGGKVFEQPHIYHGVVSGGGETQVIIQWDGSNILDRESRFRKAAKLYATEREAIAAALTALIEIEVASIKHAAAAGSAAVSARLWLDQLDRTL